MLVRPRLNDRIAHAARYPIVLVIAPAGYGKSVAVRDFLVATKRDAVRFDVRREESTLLAFARRFGAALEPLIPSAATSFPALQDEILSAKDAPQLACDWFCEQFGRTRGTIVVDDLHHAAADPDSLAFLASLVERTVDRITWILASRSDAGLPVATWLAYGRMDLPVDAYDLRFTLDEAMAAARAENQAASEEEVRSLWELTDGWPVALAIALRTQTRAAALRPAVTRELVYRYLAEQVFARVSESQREFLLNTSVFSTFDSTIARALGGTPDFIDDLRHGVAFLLESGPGQYRYHDLFRDYIENELLRLGEDRWCEALSRGARLLEERAQPGAALDLLNKARDAQSILRLIEAEGFGIFERGGADALTSALDAVPEERRRTSPVALGLQATLEAARGHFEPADRGFVAAIAQARNDDLRLSLVHRYAIELVRQGRDCTELLEAHSGNPSTPAALRVPLLGTLATTYARASRQSDAAAAIETALALDPSVGDDVRARLYQQAAYVYLLGPDRERAGGYASLAIDLALARDLYDVAVRAYSVLYTIAYEDDDDPIACLTILDKLLDAARNGGSSQGRLYGLIASYGIEGDRGNDAAMERIEALLAETPAMLAQTRSEVLLPGMALRASWQGDFHRAYHLLTQAGDRQGDERDTEHFSEAALYAAAAGMRDEANVAIDGASEALERFRRPTRRALRARLMLTFAELMRGRTKSAHHQLALVKRQLTPAMPRLTALYDVASACYRSATGQGDAATIANSLERLRARQLGGLARLLEGLPLSESGSGGYATLTATEREILTLLAAGGTTRSMAAETARSPRTIDTHVRSICKKLACRSRRDAVAIAIGAGWVQNG